MRGVTNDDVETKLRSRSESLHVVQRVWNYLSFLMIFPTI